MFKKLFPAFALSACGRTRPVARADYVVRANFPPRTPQAFASGAFGHTESFGVLAPFVGVVSRFMSVNGRNSSRGELRISSFPSIAFLFPIREIRVIRG